MSSENKSQWASMSTVADMLTSADSISRIEFYTTKRENGPVEIVCRCPRIDGMSKADIDAFVFELNVAITPVKKSKEASLQGKAANQLRRFL